MDKKLAIVTGANGKLGKAYLDHFSSKEDFYVVSFSRSAQDERSTVFKSVSVDLLDQANVSLEIEKIDFSSYKEIVLVHPVGKFKFQKQEIPEIDSDSDGIDDEVYSSNVVTLQNILTPLIGCTKNIETQIFVCAFGSISDRYRIPFWSSYSKSKNILRGILKCLTEQSVLRSKINVLFVNVSSVDTGNENKLRPYADKKFWLKPEAIVAKSLDYLLSEFTGYREIDVYNPVPNFDTNYFHNNKKIFQKWLKEME